jgi:DNA (cytosine-5)-methyltransferase 1
MFQNKLTSIELCAGAGGQALGLHWAGFSHQLLLEIDSLACQTLERNNDRHKLEWGKVFNGDLADFAEKHTQSYPGIDLVAGGVPCPPFSKAGKQLGKADERDLFPIALKIIKEIAPKAVMLENVSGLLDARFAAYRVEIESYLNSLGYVVSWKCINASNFGVPQLRPRVVLVGLRAEYFEYFSWPNYVIPPLTVGEALYDLMVAQGWQGAREWARKANKIAPTLVGGSKKHGGPDLGPTRAKMAWKELSVNGHKIGDDAPAANFKGAREGYEHMPLLTVRMAARLQGFPDWWEICGRKTAAYRQVGNAFPPPVAKAIGIQIYKALLKAEKSIIPVEFEPQQINLFSQTRLSSTR